MLASSLLGGSQTLRNDIIFAWRIPNTQQWHQETFRAAPAPGALSIHELGWPHTSNPHKEQALGAFSIHLNPGCSRALGSQQIYPCAGMGQAVILIGVPCRLFGVAQVHGQPVWQPAACTADKTRLASGTVLVSGPPGWHASPAASSTASLDPYTNTQGSAASPGFGPAVQSSSRSCFQPRLWAPREPRLCLHLVCFPWPNVSHPPGALEMPSSPAGPQAGPSACSCPCPVLPRGSWRCWGLQAWWGFLTCIHPAQAVTGKLPGSFSIVRSSCWVRWL